MSPCVLLMTSAVDERDIGSLGIREQAAEKGLQLPSARFLGVLAKCCCVALTCFSFPCTSFKCNFISIS